MKDIMASGKRLQVARLVCEPSLVILSLVAYSILDKDLVLEVFSGQGRAFAKISSCWVYEISRQGISLRKRPFLLAPRRLGHFAQRNLCDSAIKIPYRWGSMM